MHTTLFVTDRRVRSVVNLVYAAGLGLFGVSVAGLSFVVYSYTQLPGAQR